MPDCDHQHPVTADGAAVFIAVELSKSSWLLAAQGMPSGKASSHRLEAGDVGGLLALIARLRLREERTAGAPVPVVLGYEAGYDGFWLQRRLAAEGIACLVMDAASLQRSTAGHAGPRPTASTPPCCCARSPRGAAATTRPVAMVRVPTVEREDARRTHRERQRLIAERVQHVNRVKGLLSGQGVYDYQPLRRDRWARLDGARTGDGRPLPACLRLEIGRELRRLEHVLKQLGAVEAERDAAVARPAAGDADAAKVAQLARLGGIGTELATVLVREALFRAFANRREVASYAGLTPSPCASGGMRREQGISKAGNPLLRKSMVELAWLWLRYQPGSALSRWFAERAGTAAGRVRKIAAVALARKLLVALWRYVGTGLVPEGARLKGAV